MHRHLWKLLVGLGVLVVGSIAVAKGPLSSPAPLAAPPSLAVPHLATPGVEAVPVPVAAAFGGEAMQRGCPMANCDERDELCLQVAFDTLLSCMRHGQASLPACPECELPKPAQSQVFRAHGAGLKVYGVVGNARGGHQRLLRGLADTVERAPGKVDAQR